VKSRNRWVTVLANGRGIHIATAAALLALSAGCGGSPSATPPTAKVTPAEGRVLWNGQPLAGAFLVFCPESVAPGGKPLSARAQTDKQGHYKITTFAAGDGLPAGQYAVTVEYHPVSPGGEAPGGNVLPAKYASLASTDLHVTVAQGGPAVLPTLELK
jgi:hypothetical protein